MTHANLPPRAVWRIIVLFLSVYTPYCPFAPTEGTYKQESDHIPPLLRTLLLPISLRARAKILPASDKALQDFSSPPPTLLLCHSLVSGHSGLITRPVTPTPVSGPFHLSLLLPGPLSPECLHGSFPHLLKGHLLS